MRQNQHTRKVPSVFSLSLRAPIVAHHWLGRGLDDPAA